jgi:hypothetical protein
LVWHFLWDCSWCFWFGYWTCSGLFWFLMFDRFILILFLCLCVCFLCSIVFYV